MVPYHMFNTGLELIPNYWSATYMMVSACPTKALSIGLPPVQRRKHVTAADVMPEVDHKYKYRCVGNYFYSLFQVLSSVTNVLQINSESV